MRKIDADQFEAFPIYPPKGYTDEQIEAYTAGATLVLEKIDSAPTVTIAADKIETSMRLNRERWDGCEWCCDEILFDSEVMSLELFHPLRDGNPQTVNPNYCPMCGRPLTEEAWADHVMLIKTLEGSMCANPGDWIITGVHGERYPCKPDIFAETYEPVGCKQSEKTATWIWKGSDKGFECSRCHSKCLLNYESDWQRSDFCPHCGADMRGGGEE